MTFTLPEWNGSYHYEILKIMRIRWSLHVSLPHSHAWRRRDDGTIHCFKWCRSEEIAGNFNSLIGGIRFNAEFLCMELTTHAPKNVFSVFTIHSEKMFFSSTEFNLHYNQTLNISFTSGMYFVEGRIQHHQCEKFLKLNWKYSILRMNYFFCNSWRCCSCKRWIIPSANPICGTIISFGCAAFITPRNIFAAGTITSALSGFNPRSPFFSSTVWIFISSYKDLRAEKRKRFIFFAEHFKKFYWCFLQSR